VTDDPLNLGLPTSSSARARGRIAVVAIGVAGFSAGAFAGAYLNWFWWEIGYRPLVIMLAVAIMVAGGAVSLIRRVVARWVGLGLAAIAFGMLVGQYLGPVREPLIERPGGLMNLRLDSPVAATLMGVADCSNAASGTELLVVGAPEPQTGELGLPDGITVQLGDRWAYPRDNSRTDRVRLEIASTTQLEPDSIKVRSRVGMEATEASTLASSFSTEGGSIQFRDLAPLDGPGYTGESIDFEGTLEWTCGPALP
jgi:hypothetical protein